jgi:uncharacterized damage-inducible protein DinB
MNKEIKSLISSFKNVLSNEPWYGKSVYTILEEAGTGDVYYKPDQTSHSMIEILFHMNTWAEYALSIIKHEEPDKSKAIEALDWRTINPAEHNWEKGFAQFKSVNEKIIELLNTKDDLFLGQNLQDKNYNFRFLLNGLIQHHIYHAGQIAYIKKWLS